MALWRPTILDSAGFYLGASCSFRARYRFSLVSSLPDITISAPGGYRSISATRPRGEPQFGSSSRGRWETSTVLAATAVIERDGTSHNRRSSISVLYDVTTVKNLSTVSTSNGESMKIDSRCVAATTYLSTCTVHIQIRRFGRSLGSPTSGSPADIRNTPWRDAVFPSFFLFHLLRSGSRGSQIPRTCSTIADGAE